MHHFLTLPFASPPLPYLSTSLVPRASVSPVSICITSSHTPLRISTTPIPSYIPRLKSISLSCVHMHHTFSHLLSHLHHFHKSSIFILRSFRPSHEDVSESLSCPSSSGHANPVLCVECILFICVSSFPLWLAEKPKLEYAKNCVYTWNT